MTVDFTNLDAMNRQAEQQLREALGTGTVRDEWPRKESFWAWVVGTALAGAIGGVFLAWLLYP